MDRVAAVRELYESWNRGDPDDFIARLDPEIEFQTSGVYPGLASVYRGREAQRRFWNDFKGMWDQLTIEVVELREVGERVVALYEFEGRGRGGLVVRRPGANIFTFRDGAVVAITAHGSWDDALDAAVYP